MFSVYTVMSKHKLKGNEMTKVTEMTEMTKTYRWGDGAACLGGKQVCLFAFAPPVSLGKAHKLAVQLLGGK